ncbi:MAG TPA: PAS domain-containing protein [Proteobacteria bacterium]|nr:PAS domain-containing protein [Pseudomonadota bacterium]
MRGETGLFTDFLSYLKTSWFVRFLVFLSLSAVLLLVFFPGYPAVLVFSVVVHGFVALAIVWFGFRVIRPVQLSMDQLFGLLERGLAGERRESPPSSGIRMGRYRELLKRATNLFREQYDELLNRSKQLENFAGVLEKQNLKLSESRQRYRRTMDALDNGIYLVDEDYVVRAINRAEAAYYGSEPKQIVGRRCYEIFRQRQRPCPDCLPRECMADGQVRNRLRVESRRAGRGYVNIFCYPIFHEGETRSHEAVVYIQDTSPLVMMEDQVVRAEKMASIGQMAAGIAHDLNNYLAGIYGVVQILELRFENAPAGREKDLHLLGRLKEQVEALNLMAGNLMVFSHPERKELFPLSLNQVIEDALSFSRYELEREQVRVVKKLQPDLPLARMEKGQIQQVFLNLMLNAAQAIRERKKNEGADYSGVIEVVTGAEDEARVFFSISDNGGGISRECRDHLFDPFFSTKEVSVERGATGLGLFTARTVMEQHQGEISFSSEINQGSTFKVVLPWCQESGVCFPLSAGGPTKLA